MKGNTYTTVAKRANPISKNNKPDDYRALIEKLIQLLHIDPGQAVKIGNAPV